MFYLNPTKMENGAYGALQSRFAPGLLQFPETFLPVFYPADKRFGGFVDIRHDGEAVTECVWNEEAYRAYAEHQTAAPEEKTLAERVAELEARVAALEKLLAAAAEETV